MKLMAAFSFACALAIAATSVQIAAATAPCAVADLQQRAPKDTTIKAAVVVEAKGNVPQHCKVDGTVATDGNTVDFTLGLPQNWNGKFYFQGVGGFAGSMGRLDDGLQRGYASASTDTGHQGGTTDARWALNNRPKEIDYGYRGTHVTSVAAKAVTQAYFGNAPSHAYFNGCSNGGRQALMEAQRFPDDYDGIIAGDPSLGLLGYIKRITMAQTMLQSPDHALTPAKLAVISKATLAACDKTDGLEDGLVSDPRTCKFDPGTLLCKNGDGPDCLTKGQVETAKAIYSDLKAPNGDIVYGFPIGHEAGQSGWQSWITGANAPAPEAGKTTTTFGQQPPTGYRFFDGFFRYMAFEQDDPNYDFRTFDVAKDFGRIQTMAQIVSPTDPNLTKLQQRGGKLIIYHGWADPALSAYSTIHYYNEVVKALGGKAKADEAVRLFLIPGMNHCSGGPGPNTFEMLDALEQWVEKKQPPAQVIASHATGGKVDRTRPLCPEPQVAVYKGSGSVDEASSFRCDARR